MLEEIKENFSFLTDWEDKYAYLIDIGKELPKLQESEKTLENKVDGCMSQVWLVSEEKDGKLYFRAESDALIVEGLVALILAVYSGKTPDEILSVDLKGLFAELGLAENLSPTRRNGFFSMQKKIIEQAQKLKEVQ